MPCACKAPIEQYPENAEWGPLFWRLLHAMAERAGKQTEPIGQQDELRLWQNLLTSLKDTLPCDVCRNHYGEWLKEHPPELLELPYGEFHAWIKTWLWTLHNRINEGNDKPTFKFEDLHDMYKASSLDTCVESTGTGHKKSDPIEWNFVGALENLARLCSPPSGILSMIQRKNRVAIMHSAQTILSHTLLQEDLTLGTRLGRQHIHS